MSGSVAARNNCVPASFKLRDGSIFSLDSHKLALKTHPYTSTGMQSPGS